MNTHRDSNNIVIQQSKKNSINDLQLQMELEELQSNLIKTIRSKSTLPQSCEDEKNPQETLCNYNDEKKAKTMEQILKKMLKMKKDNNFISKDIFDKHVVVTRKEKMIMQLYEELNFFLNENSQLEIDLEELKKLREECEINRDGVTEYCKELKFKFKSFVEIIDKYEEKIATLKKQRDSLIVTNDSILEMKSNIFIVFIIFLSEGKVKP
jgi:hypothetical protein